MIDTATAKQLLQSTDITEIQNVVNEYKDYEDPDVANQYQILKLLLLLQNRILQLQQQQSISQTDQSHTYCGMAKCWMSMGDLEKCQGQLTKALSADSNNIAALLLQGEVESAQAKYEKAIERTEQAIQLLQKQQKSDNSSDSKILLQLSNGYSKLASIYEMMGDFEQAMAVLVKSVAECCPDKSTNPDDIDRTMVTATLLGHLGTIQEKLGKYSDAVVSLTTAVDAYRISFGPKHAKTQEIEFLLEMATSTTAK